MLNLKPDAEFKEWPKIPRGQGEAITITEKIDGTNACIVIEGGEIISIQSRKQRIYPAAIMEEKRCDNMGFAAWVMEHAEELVLLGDGYHYGEWAGPGIQKNPHLLKEKTFYLFNSQRWVPENTALPSCCSVVPVLYSGPYEKDAIDEAMCNLELIARVDEKKEGVIVYFHKTRRYEKYTYRSQGGKWQC